MNTELMNELKELTLRECRIKLGMTMDEMAEELNFPKPSYKYLESKNKFTEEIVQKVNEIYEKAKGDI